MLILHGSRDELVPQHPTLDDARALPKDAGHCLAVYRTGWHLLLRDLKVRTVWDEIVAWIANLAERLPSGAVKQVQAISPFPNLPIAARRRARYVPRASERSPFKIGTAQGHP